MVITISNRKDGKTLGLFITNSNNKTFSSRGLQVDGGLNRLIYSGPDLNVHFVACCLSLTAVCVSAVCKIGEVHLGVFK